MGTSKNKHQPFAYLKRWVLLRLKKHWLSLLLFLLGFFFIVKSLESYNSATKMALYAPAGFMVFQKTEDDTPNFSELNGCFSSVDKRVDTRGCDAFWNFGFLSFVTFELIVIIFIVKLIKNLFVKKNHDTKTETRKTSRAKRLLKIGLKIGGLISLQILASGFFSLALVLTVRIELDASNDAGFELKSVSDRLLQEINSGESVIGDIYKIVSVIKHNSEITRLAEIDKIKLSALYLRKANLNNLSYYEKFILMSVDDEEIEEELKKTFLYPLVYFVDYKTVLVIRESFPEMTTFLPVIAFQNLDLFDLTKDYVDKNTEPNFNLLSTEDYNEIIKKRNDEVRRKYLGTIQEIRGDIARLANYADETSKIFGKIEQNKADYESRTNSWFSDCRRILGESHSTCIDGKKTIEENIQKYQREIDKTKGYIEEASGYQEKARVNLGRWEQVLINFDKNPVKILDQGGVFFSPKDIYVRFTNDDDSAGELGTSIHELLHFYANRSNITLPIFIIEGTTEYLATKVRDTTTIKLYGGTGYPELTNIASSLAKNMGEEQLIEIYFSGSLSKFKKIFTDTYGSSDYKLFMDLGSQLFYAPLNDEISRDELLKQMLGLINGV